MKKLALRRPGTTYHELHAMAQTLIWDSLPDVVQYVLDIAKDSTQETSDRLKACGMILDRTIPTVARVHKTSDEPRDGNAPNVDWDEIHSRALDEAAREATNGDARIH